MINGIGVSVSLGENRAEFDDHWYVCSFKSIDKQASHSVCAHCFQQTKTLQYVNKVQMYVRDHHNTYFQSNFSCISKCCVVCYVCVFVLYSELNTTQIIIGQTHACVDRKVRNYSKNLDLISDSPSKTQDKTLYLFMPLPTPK